MQMLIKDGPALKSNGSNIEGHCILFSGSADPDLERDFFTAATDFDLAGLKAEGYSDVRSLYYHHGLDPTIGNRKIGTAKFAVDDTGVYAVCEIKISDPEQWADIQEDKREQYIAKIKKLAEDGKLGYSTGAIAHLVRRKSLPDGTAEIKAWPIGELSLTPTPCEPRTNAVIKSLDEMIGDDAKAENKMAEGDDSDGGWTTGHDVADAGMMRLHNMLGNKIFSDMYAHASGTKKAADVLSNIDKHAAKFSHYAKKLVSTFVVDPDNDNGSTKAIADIFAASLDEPFLAQGFALVTAAKTYSALAARRQEQRLAHSRKLSAEAISQISSIAQNMDEVLATLKSLTPCEAPQIDEALLQEIKNTAVACEIFEALTGEQDK